jgi:hypothetical protein
MPPGFGGLSRRRFAFLTAETLPERDEALPERL